MPLNIHFDPRAAPNGSSRSLLVSGATGEVTLTSRTVVCRPRKVSGNGRHTVLVKGRGGSNLVKGTDDLLSIDRAGVKLT